MPDRITPPSWMDKLLAAYCSAHRFEELKGDLHELYAYDYKTKGRFLANSAYLRNVFSCMKPYAYKSNHHHYPKSRNTMIFKNLTVSFRNLSKNWSYSLINLVGLTLGIVCASFIFLFVTNEQSYDSFHKESENLYTVPFTWHFGETSLPTARATSNIGPLLKQEYPEVQQFLRLKPGSRVLKSSTVSAEENAFIYADSTFFKLLTFELLQGDPGSALTEPKSILLTEKTAEKYFGQDWTTDKIVGQTILVENKEEYIITGVAKNPPKNSHIQFDVLASFTSLPEAGNLTSFDNSAYMTYVQLVPDANVPALLEKMESDIRKGFNGELPIELGLTPFTDIYLKSGMNTGVGPIGDESSVQIFALIGLVIIIIACINYMNLATARATERAKEIGVRKVMGAGRLQLVYQFLVESFLISFISVLLALVLIALLLPLFNQLALRDFTLDFIAATNFLSFLGAVWLFVSLFAGFYPAFALSGFSITGVLRGKFKNSASGSSLRKFLVICQFSISVVLVVATLVIFQQLDFIEKKELGYDKDMIISMPLDPQIESKIGFLKQELNKLSGVSSTSVTGQLPSNISFESTIAASDGEENRKLMRLSYIDDDYLKTLGLKTVSGGVMSPNNKEKYEFLINESAASFYGWSAEEAVGKQLKIWNREWGTIVGVVKDFHFASLHQPIKPLLLYNLEAEVYGKNHMLVRVAGEDFSGTIDRMKKLWDATIDHKPFRFVFLNDRLDDSYKKEAHLSMLISTFAIIALIIGSLGLFGLVSYTAYQKSKEIGVRKVLGASMTDIVFILSTGFSKQVIIALILGVSLAYYLMNLWLESFEYKTTIGLDVISIACLVTLGIAFFTMSFKSIQAGLLNPADTLRSE